MTTNAETSTISGIVVDLPHLSLNFPPPDKPEVFRDNIAQALKALLEESAYLVSVEGPDGIGKTTILSHFARRNPATTVSIFVSAANRLSFDPDLMRCDIAGQVYWAATGETLERSRFTPDLLKAYFSELQRKAKQKRELYYFLVDGLDELPVNVRDGLLQQLPEMLPIGIPQFRFLFSGDGSLYSDLLDKRLAMKSFPLTPFSLDEVRTFFSEQNLSLESSIEINSACRGFPGRLAEVRRAMTRGILPVKADCVSLSTLTGLFEIDWRQVDKNNQEQERLLALLAHDSKPHSVSDISSILDISMETARHLISLTNFLILDAGETDVRFASAGLRRYAAELLIGKKSQIQKLLIKRLLSTPDSDNSILDLSEYMEEAAQYQDLLAILTPEHILQVLERGQTLSRVADAVKRGFRSAVRLGRDADVFRFGLQKAIISELASSNVWESEVAALAALDREPEATVLATNAILREDRLQMLATLSHHIWLKGSPVPSELIDQIRLLIDNLDYWSLGRRAQSIASKLVCVSPDLATTLLRKAKWITEDDDSDRTFARVTAIALGDVKDEQRRSQAIEALVRSKQSQKTGSLLEGVRVLAGRLSPLEVCAHSRDIGLPESQISILRHWCKLNGRTPDADLVAMHGLKLALGASSTSIDSSLLADFSQALDGAPTPARSSELIGILDGVRPTAERLGPSVDYVRLQLSLAKAEASLDGTAAESRIVQLLSYVDGITDLPTRGESYAHFLAGLREISARGRCGSTDSLRMCSSSELESVVLILAESTADHHLALGGIICALAMGDLEKALDYTRVMNTEGRRDAVLADVVDALLQQSISNIDLTGMLRVCKGIVDDEVRGGALESILERFSEERHLGPNKVRELLPILSELPDIVESMTSCRTLVDAIKVLRTNAPTQYTSLELHLKSALRRRWQSIDIGWARIDAGYGITRDLATVDRAEAEAIFSETETMKSEGQIAAPQAAATFIGCLRLLTRAFCGLLPGHRETEADIETMASLIDILPSFGERAVLWADVCTRASLAGRSDLADQICSTYLQPTVELIPKEDILYRSTTLIRVAPALYRSQPAVCLDALDSLSADNRDTALLQTIRFLLRRRAPFDPYDPESSADSHVSYEILLQVETLATRLSTDWMIYLTASEVADAINSSKGKLYLNHPQCEDISRRFNDLARTKLPVARQITHNGYRLATLAQGARMCPTNAAVWTQLIDEAKTLSNVSDRAFVLQIIGLSLPNHMADKAVKLLEIIQKDIDCIPWTFDQVDRLIGLAEAMRGSDNQLCRLLITKAAGALGRSGDDLEEQRRHLIDVAFRLDDDFAKKLIEGFDDDDAKRLAKSHVHLLEIRHSIAEAKGRPESETKVKHLRASEVSKLGSMLLRSLGAGRVQDFHPSDIRDYLDLASKQALSKSFSMFSWYIENAVIRYSRNEQAGTFLRPMFDACVLGAQLTGRISGRSLIRLRALRTHSAQLNIANSLLVTPRSREEAKSVISRWFEKSLGKNVMIHDQYFSPSDLEWLQLIRIAKADCTIVVMTSRRHQPSVPAGEELEDVYVSAWRQVYDQTPPKAEIAVIGGEIKKESPIHDRWLISDGAGLRFGTSFNSLGISKESEVSQMSEADVEQKRREIEQYLNREKTDFEGEKLRLTRFWL